ncbi:hypothetical protein PHISP_03305 [Aspergillus sp. HF37]|nr:hypothetical protein PHISP_03305 [Aspergillus sp. HF37]
MTSLRLSTLQPLLRGAAPILRLQQRRWAQVHDVRFLATHHDPKHVHDKYRSKLDQKAKQEGHGSVESLREAYQDKIDDLRKKASTVESPTPDQSSFPQETVANPAQQPQKPFSPPPPPSPQSPEAHTVASAAESAKSDSPIKPLSSYLDVDKVRDLPPQEIEALWRLRHVKNPLSVCACIPLDTYQRIAAAARQNPQFILPLPRQTTEQEGAASSGEGGDGNAATSSGADIHFLQWAFHPPASPATPGNTHTSTVIFTHLAAFKTQGSYAQPHTTLTHHLDLAQDKGIVLMQGLVMPDSGVSAPEASWLASCVQRFYDFGGQAQGRKGELVRMFTKGDAEGFKVEALLDEAEKL